MKCVPNTYNEWAIGRIIERPYVLFAPERLPDLGVRVYLGLIMHLQCLGYSVYLGVILRLPRLGVRVWDQILLGHIIYLYYICCLRLIC